MKRFNFWRSLFFSALAVMAFAACSDNDDDKGGGGAGEASVTVNGKEAVALGVTGEAGAAVEASIVSSGAWTLAFEGEQSWCVASALAGNAGVSTVKFTADALPEGVEERSATAVVTTTGEIFGMPYNKTAKISIRQSASGKATPATNVAAVRALLKAMNPTQTKTPVTEALAAMSIVGVVGSDAEGGNMGDAFYIAVQDETPAKNSGLTLSNTQFSTLKPETGTVVSIPLTGAQVGTYGGVIQLTLSNDAVVSSWAAGLVPEPVVVAPAELLDYESMVVKVENCYPTDNIGEPWYNTTSKGSVNFVTKDGEAFVGYMGSKASIGTTVVPDKMGSLIGIAGQFNGTKQVKPRTEADIQLTGEIPPVEYEKVTLAELKAGNCEVEATIVAVYQKGLMLADGTGYTLVFNNAWDKQDSNPYIGDVNKKATVKGKVVDFNGLLQFSTPDEITIGAASDLVLPEPVAFDAAGLTAYESAKKYEYVSLTGVLSITEGTSGSNKYNSYTVAVAGYSAKTVTLAYGLDAYYAGLATGDVVDVKGFAVGFDASKINIMTREVAKNTTTPALTFTTTPKVFAGADFEPQVIGFTAQNIPDNQLINFSFTGDNADKFDVRGQDAASVTIKPVGNNATGAAYNATLVAKLGDVVLAEVAVAQNPADVKNYVPLTAAPADWSGDYIVGYVVDKTCSILDAKKAADATSTFFTRTVLEAPAFDGTNIVYDASYHTITLAKIEGTEYYSMKYGEEYVGWTSGIKNNCSFTGDAPSASTPDYQWSLSMNENSEVVFTLTTQDSGKNRNFQYNANSSQERFSTYTGSQKPVKLFQLAK